MTHYPLMGVVMVRLLVFLHPPNHTFGDGEPGHFECHDAEFNVLVHE